MPQTTSCHSEPITIRKNRADDSHLLEISLSNESEDELLEIGDLVFQ